MEHGISLHVKGGVGWIRISRPERRNSLDQDALRAFCSYLEKADDDRRVSVIAFTGEGRDFCTGHDLKELASEHEETTTFDEVYDRIRNTSKPVIAAVNGTCIGGGCGMALAADIRVMARSTELSYSQAKRGLSSVGGPTLLARAVPVNIALEVMFTGGSISATRCLELGIANRLVDDEDLESDVAEVAAAVRACSPVAVSALKRATLEAVDLPSREAMRLAQSVLDEVLESEDAREGLAAFAEHRQPRWPSQRAPEG